MRLKIPAAADPSAFGSNEYDDEDEDDGPAVVVVVVVGDSLVFVSPTVIVLKYKY
jgi:uncharacterized protein (DUF983 family)